MNLAIRMNPKALAICAAICAALPFTAHGAVTPYSRDLAGFEAAASGHVSIIDFEDIAEGTDISGQTLHGVTFVKLGAPLMVVAGTNTYTPGGFSGLVNAETNKLFATSGKNVLSPGGLMLAPGPAPAIEGDSLELRFATPVSAVGFDHLSQSADGVGMTFVSVYTATSNLLYSGWIPITNYFKLGGGAPGSADFWGVVSTSTNISRITLSESDSNAEYPDSNIGIDTIRILNLSWPEIWIARVSGGLEIRFTGRLETATSPNEPWQELAGANSPLFLPDDTLQSLQLFRAVMR